MQRWLGVFAVLLLSACAEKILPLDEILPDARARVGLVRKESELIGGPIAFGRVGEVWKLYNSKARFLIQDVGTATGLGLYGGNLIDMDLVRPDSDGKNGNDLFRETFPIVGLHVHAPRGIQVVASGDNGGPAILRVVGTDAPSDILPPLDNIALDLGGEIITDYVLEPDTTALKVVTTYRARSGQSFDSLGFGDFLAFGSGVTLFQPENGFLGDKSSVSFLSSRGEGASYGYVFADGPLQLILVDASGTAVLVDSPPVPTDGTASLTRYFVVGDGDCASLSGPMYALKGQETVHLSGVVRDATGAAIEGANVTIFRAPMTAESQAFDQARSHGDGTYAFDLPPGEYLAIATAAGRLRGAATAISALAMATVDLQIGARGEVALDIGEILGGTRKAVPAKATFRSMSVELPDRRFGPQPNETESGDAYAVGFALADGKGRVLVKPGTYQVTVSRGFEYELVVLENFVVPETGAAQLTTDLVRVVDTTGWISGDFHQHTQGSIDSPVPTRNRLIENLAEGVEFPVATEHDNIVDFRTHIAALAAEDFANSFAGDEISVNGIGHFNAYPLTVDVTDPFAKVGAKLWARKKVEEWVPALRATEADPIVVQINHPRGGGLSGYLQYVKFDPTTGNSSEPLEIFDAVEVNTEVGVPEDYLVGKDADVHKEATKGGDGIAQMRDWFTLLNLGREVSGMGNSDVHPRNGGAGYPRNYLWIEKDAPRDVTGADVVQAVKSQRVGVADGIFVTALLDGQVAYGKQKAKTAAAEASLGVKVQAASWVNVATIEIYENGRPLSLLRSMDGSVERVAEGTAGAVFQLALVEGDKKSAVLRFDAGVKLHPTKDAWYVVLARGPGSLMPVAGDRPLGYTPAIYLDLGGDGWSAPGL